MKSSPDQLTLAVRIEGHDGRGGPLNHEAVDTTVRPEDLRPGPDPDKVSIGKSERSSAEVSVAWDHSSVKLNDQVVAAVVVVAVVDPAAVVPDELSLDRFWKLSRRVVVWEPPHDLVDVSQFGEVVASRGPQVEAVSGAVEVAGHWAAILILEDNRISQ